VNTYAKCHPHADLGMQLWNFVLKWSLCAPVPLF